MMFAYLFYNINDFPTGSAGIGYGVAGKGYFAYTSVSSVNILMGIITAGSGHYITRHRDVLTTFFCGCLRNRAAK